MFNSLFFASYKTSKAAQISGRSCLWHIYSLNLHVANIERIREMFGGSLTYRSRYGGERNFVVQSFRERLVNKAGKFGQISPDNLGQCCGAAEWITIQRFWSPGEHFHFQEVPFPVNYPGNAKIRTLCVFLCRTRGAMCNFWQLACSQWSK